MAPGTIIDRFGSDIVIRGSQQKVAAGLFPQGLSRHGKKYLRDVQIGHDSTELPTSFLIDYFVEWVRLAEFPDRPSRFSCLFALGDLADVPRLMAAMRLRTSDFFVWRIEALETPAYDMNLLTGRTPLEAMAFAEAYWRGDSMRPGQPLWEHLLPGPVRVVDRVDIDAPGPAT